MKPFGRSTPTQNKCAELQEFVHALISKRRSEVRKEWKRRLQLHHQGLSSLGRAARRLEVYEELLMNDVKEWVAIYRKVAIERGCPQMLAKDEIESLQGVIIESVHQACLSLTDQNAREFNSDGNVPPVASKATQQRVRFQLEPNILAVVNTEIRVLEAEGKLMVPERTVSADGNSTACASAHPATQLNSLGRKRGPRPDYDTAFRFAEIVARIAPDGDWRSRLEDICEALDEKNVPIPTTWRRNRNCRCWVDCTERPVLIKAVEYRIKLAKQRKKLISETFS